MLFRDGQAIDSESISVSQSNCTTKRIWLPPEIFQLIKEIPGTDSTEYRCLLGCTPKHKADGSIKYVSVSLFSQSGLIFTDKRNGLTDQHFEMSVFLKVNKHVFDKW